MKKKVLVSAPYMQMDFDKLKEIFIERDVDVTLPIIREKMDENELIKIIGEYDGVICGDDPFTRKVFESTTKLKVVSKWGTGINAIDLQAAADHGVKVCNTPNAFSHPVADTTLAFMLAFARNVMTTDKQMKKGEWDKIRGFTLSEKTLGIIGLGNIGSQVAKRASAFNMHIIANDIKPISPIILEQYGITQVSKEEIFKNADFISIHCDLNEDSFHVLNEDAFALMTRRPHIINTARGSHISHSALLYALENNIISGAALDVFEEEPIPADDPILTRDDVILAPHNSNNSPKYWAHVHTNTIKNLFKYL